jgi:hypothetical protein
MNTDYKMGRGLPRGEKVVVKVGSRQADILLDLEKMVWAVTFDKSDLPVLEYPTLQNAVMSAETILKEDRN